MTDEQRKRIERRLLSERGRLLAILRQAEANTEEAGADGDLTNHPLHLADAGTDAIEQEKELLLRSAEGRMLYQIDEALRRLYRGPADFGQCQRCGRTIAFARLSLVPWTVYCLDCQKLAETDARTGS